MTTKKETKGKPPLVRRSKAEDAEWAAQREAALAAEEGGMLAYALAAEHYEEALKIANELGIVKRLMDWAMAIDPWSGYPNMAISLGWEHFEFPEDNEEEFRELFIDALHTIIYFAKDEYWNLDNILNPDYTGGSENEPDPRITPEIEAWYDSEISWKVFSKLRGYDGEGVVA